MSVGADGAKLTRVRRGSTSGVTRITAGRYGRGERATMVCGQVREGSGTLRTIKLRRRTHDVLEGRSNVLCQVL
jgi:hypothetical protein